MNFVAALIVMVLAMGTAAAELPDIYKEVDRVVWVVRDLDETIAAWKKTGLVSIYAEDDGDRERIALGWFGSVRAAWVQPRAGTGPYAAFLEKHGPGVLALVHRAGNAEQWEAESRRLGALGVSELLMVETGGTKIRLFDTERYGRYVLGVALPAADEPAPPANARRVTQFAFAIREHIAASRYWEKLGWPEIAASVSTIHDMTYHEEPASFGATLGWQRHGKVPYEWIIPTKAPSVWHDHIARHGEGFHHFAFQVDDMDKAIEQWKSWGFPFAQGGGWGQKGQKGSGRFAYMDAEHAGGVQIELLWSFR